MSATPRTNAMERELYETRPSQWEVDQLRLSLCRTLETELAAVTKQRDEFAALFEHHMDYNNIIECARADIREQIQTVLNQ